MAKLSVNNCVFNVLTSAFETWFISNTVIALMKNEMCTKMSAPFGRRKRDQFQMKFILTVILLYCIPEYNHDKYQLNKLIFYHFGS